MTRPSRRRVDPALLARLVVLVGLLAALVLFFAWQSGSCQGGPAAPPEAEER